MESIIYNKYSNERDPKFNIRTEIVLDDGTKKVCKYATNKESELHVAQMYNTYVNFQKMHADDTLQLCECQKEDNRVVFSFIEGQNLKDILTEAIVGADNKKIEDVLERFYQVLVKLSEKKKFGPSEEYIAVFGEQVPDYGEDIYVVNPANIDLIFENIVIKDEKWYVLDYEWTFSFDVPMEFVLYRALFYLMYNSPYILKYQSLGLYEKFGITQANIMIYDAMEAAFQSYVVGETHAIKEYYQPGIDIKELVVKKMWERDEIIVSIYEDYGEGFSEEHKISFVKKLTESGEFSLSYKFPAEVNQVRIDPGEVPLIFDMQDIIQGIVDTNASYCEGNKMCFLNNDPWIIVSKEKTENQIVISGRIDRLNELAVKEIVYAQNQINMKKTELNNANQELNNANQKLNGVNQELQNAIKTIDEMKNSTSWKITYPIRWLGSLGGKYKKKSKVIVENKISKMDINALVPEIGIHVHLFYTDLLEEFVSYFKKIPYKFNLYISCIDGADIEYIEKYTKQNLSNMNQVIVKVLENRGRDIAPFYVGFGKEIQQHKYVLHVHSKKSKHIETGGGDWRVYSLDSLVGSKELVEKIIGKFDSEENIGLVYPECHPDIPMIGYTWMANGMQGKKFLEEMGIPYEEGIFHYPAGSFFWARVDALAPIFQKNLAYEDFPDEQGQIDGTLAHVLERAIVFVSKSRGYHSYIVDIRENVFRFDNSTKPYKEYMGVDVEKLKEILMQYDSISFSVFDTLIATDFTREIDLFEIVKQKLGLNDDYIRYRCEAQKIAREKKGSTMSLEDALLVLLQISPFDEGGILQLRKTELDSIKQSVYPRLEMREVYRYLIENGKKVSIVSDSCYSKDVLETLLVKCGFIGYEKIYASAELGYSKQNEHVWNLVYHDYNPEKHIHVGSDVYADWYTLEKRGTKSFWVMSGMEAYKLSKYYDANKIPESYEESVVLGKNINREWFNSPLDLVHNDGML